MWVAVAVVATLILLALGGLAYATADYSRRYEGRILPGARLAGIEVGGLSRQQALDALDGLVERQLSRAVTVSWKQREWQVTPEELGARSNVAEVVDAALVAGKDASFFDKAQMALFGEKMEFERDVAFVYPRRGPHAFIKRLAAGIDRDAVDASLDYSTGWVEITPARRGRKVDVKASTTALTRALRSGGSGINLAVGVIEPKETAEHYDQVLLLRIGENRLYLYEDGVQTRSWKVATGLPEYKTPTGRYHVTLKRNMPTWTNPDPSGWGKSMPKSIPPGPNNPLGVRALNWSAAGIRFHGTSATHTLGFNASHGCVRLSNDEVKVLFDLVDVGAHIVSIEVGPYKPMRGSRGPDPGRGG